MQAVVSRIQSLSPLQKSFSIPEITGVHQGLRGIQLDINLPLGHGGGAHVHLCSLLLLSCHLIGEGQLGHGVGVFGGKRLERFQRQLILAGLPVIGGHRTEHIGVVRRLAASRLQPLLGLIPVSHTLVGARHQQFGARITLLRLGAVKISQGLLGIGKQEQFSGQAQVLSATGIGRQGFLHEGLGLLVAAHLGIGLGETRESRNRRRPRLKPVIVGINGSGITSREPCRITQEKPEIGVLGSRFGGTFGKVRRSLEVALVERLLSRPSLARHLDARAPPHPAVRDRPRRSSLSGRARTLLSLAGGGIGAWPVNLERLREPGRRAGQQHATSNTP